MKRTKIAKTGTLISSFFNVWLFNGSPDESISAASYRLSETSEVWEKRRIFIDRLWAFFGGSKFHTYEAYLTDKKNAEKYLNPLSATDA